MLPQATQHEFVRAIVYGSASVVNDLPERKEFQEDGVLNTYTGNFDVNFIPPVKEGAKELLEKLSESFEIKLFTTRNRLLASKWVIENKLENYISDITNVKDVSYLIIDDRCICFNGDFKKLYDDINNFKVWYKK